MALNDRPKRHRPGAREIRGNILDNYRRLMVKKELDMSKRPVVHFDNVPEDLRYYPMTKDIHHIMYEWDWRKIVVRIVNYLNHSADGRTGQWTQRIFKQKVHGKLPWTEVEVEMLLEELEMAKDQLTKIQMELHEIIKLNRRG